MVRTLLKSRHGKQMAMTARLLIVAPALVLFVRLLSYPPSSRRPVNRLRPATRSSSRLKSLVASADVTRQQALLTALRAWRSGPFPSTAAVVAAGCPLEGAAAAALELAPGRPGIVVDVGAHHGHPVTLAALQLRARLVLSVEPDARNFGMLRRRAMKMLANDGSSRFVGVHGAVGAEASTKQMRFHRTRDDFSCFTCLDGKSSEVYSADVRVATLDNLLEEAGAKTDEEISLLKTDTQGFEMQVLQGASRIFGRRLVKAVLAEFDPKLLGRRANAVGLLETLVEYGMQCVHLEFSDLKGRGRGMQQFPELPITLENVQKFYDFVVAQGGWTDLLCLRRPA